MTDPASQLGVTPLDLALFSPTAQRALAPGPGRSMAARGLMPLPPRDQLMVLFQLALDSDESLAQAARATAGGLPDKLVVGALVDPTMPPNVLEFFGELAIDKPAVFEAVVLNATTADPSIARLASRAGAGGVDLIANNEQRLLRHPEIIAAMYMNRRARMSTIDRVIELAVRNQVRVPGLAAWDEVAKALSGELTGSENDALLDAVLDASKGTSEDAAPAQDDDDRSALTRSYLLLINRRDASAVRVALRKPRMLLGSAERADHRIANVPEQWLAVQADDNGAHIVVIATNQRHELQLNHSIVVDDAKLTLAVLPFRDLPVSAKVRAATLGDAFVRAEAVRDSVSMVYMAAIKAPGVTDREVERYAANAQLPNELIQYIAKQRQWTRNYKVMKGLACNPKAPAGEVSRLLPHLRERDLQMIVRSKGVPSAVVAMARRLQMTRGSKE